MKNLTTKTSTGICEPWALWITGLPGSGKSTIARKVRDKLLDREILCKILKLDEIRKFITPDPRYTEEERDIVYYSLAYMAKLTVDDGKNVIIDATANRMRYRKKAKDTIVNFIEAYVRCPLEICMEREGKREIKYFPQGIYKKGLDKESNTVPGIGVPYEESNPEIIVDSSKDSAEKCSDMIVEKMRGSGNA
ncbi:MAG: putative adenylyl-sulfate kinase [Candidatus Methanolliviera sp. GoM_asphalt]|nr:MAG: putative adenylyl-sulfate kinase [Candidatus Methanolliviera sp. GoM_asphalt]